MKNRTITSSVAVGIVLYEQRDIAAAPLEGARVLSSSRHTHLAKHRVQKVEALGLALAYIGPGAHQARRDGRQRHLKTETVLAWGHASLTREGFGQGFRRKAAGREMALLRVGFQPFDNNVPGLPFRDTLRETRPPAGYRISF